MAAISYGQAKQVGIEGIREDKWKALVAMNAAGLATMGLGAVRVGISIALPARSAPIREVEEAP